MIFFLHPLSPQARGEEQKMSALEETAPTKLFPGQKGVTEQSARSKSGWHESLRLGRKRPAEEKRGL